MMEYLWCDQYRTDSNETLARRKISDTSRRRMEYKIAERPRENDSAVADATKRSTLFSVIPSLRHGTTNIITGNSGMAVAYRGRNDV